MSHVDVVEAVDAKNLKSKICHFFYQYSGFVLVGVVVARILNMIMVHGSSRKKLLVVVDVVVGVVAKKLNVNIFLDWLHKFILGRVVVAEVATICHCFI